MTVKTVQITETTTGIEEKSNMPESFVLEQNFPNPFNPETTIRFSVPAKSFVTIKVYNMNGQLIKTLISSDITAGNHTVRWDGRNETGSSVGSGVYFCVLDSGKTKTMKKMLLIK